MSEMVVFKRDANGKPTWFCWRSTPEELAERSRMRKEARERGRLIRESLRRRSSR